MSANDADFRKKGEQRFDRLRRMNTDIFWLLGSGLGSLKVAGLKS